MYKILLYYVSNNHGQNLQTIKKYSRLGMPFECTDECHFISSK